MKFDLWSEFPFTLLIPASESDRLIKNMFIPQFPISHLLGWRLSLSRTCNKRHVAQVHCGFVFIYLPVHVLYSGLICCFEVLKRATGFSVACSPRWTPLKGAFSSFQHLGLLQIPRLSNFKEICPQNSRIIVFTFLPWGFL